jgi:hypothetical protein
MIFFDGGSAGFMEKEETENRIGLRAMNKYKR